MSFALTTAQVISRQKTVTRRTGWLMAKVGDQIQAIEKGQGLKKGERVKKLAIIRIVSVRREPLNRMLKEPSYGRQELVKEGDLWASAHDFVSMFCRANDCQPYVPVTRIEFVYEPELSS